MQTNYFCARRVLTVHCGTREGGVPSHNVVSESVGVRQIGAEVAVLLLIS